jgi:hypothetical protein
MCFFFVQEYLDILHLIVHIAFHLHNCIVYFLSALQKKILSIACKCLGSFSYSWQNIILAKKYLFIISPSRKIIFWWKMGESNQMKF